MIWRKKNKKKDEESAVPEDPDNLIGLRDALETAGVRDTRAQRDYDYQRMQELQYRAAMQAQSTMSRQEHDYLRQQQMREQKLFPDPLLKAGGLGSALGGIGGGFGMSSTKAEGGGIGRFPSIFHQQDIVDALESYCCETTEEQDAVDNILVHVREELGLE